jgi:hypothetical protein
MDLAEEAHVGQVARDVLEVIGVRSLPAAIDERT